MPARVRSRLAPRALVLLALSIAAHASGGPAQQPPARSDSSGRLDEWAGGPVRWLLLPAEQRRLREISDPAFAQGFIERFWARRDPDPATEVNPFRDTFYKRVEAADLLYLENGLRGSLTDRGRALILLGSPTGLKITSQDAMSWDPSAKAQDNVRIRQLPVEIWTYRLGDFERPLRQALMALGDEKEFRVGFVKEVDRTSLSEGETLLDLAARTALALDTE